jgi:hypothetical protein
MGFKSFSVILAVCAGVASAVPAAAATYKWVDANGRTVYSDQPPADGKAEKLNATSAPADPNAMRDLLNKDNEIKKRQAQRQEDAAKGEKAEADSKRRADQCTQTRGRIKSLREEAILYRYNEKGEKVVMETRDRQQALSDNEKILRDLTCPAAAG